MGRGRGRARALVGAERREPRSVCAAPSRSPSRAPPPRVWPGAPGGGVKLCQESGIERQAVREAQEFVEGSKRVQEGTPWALRDGKQEAGKFVPRSSPLAGPRHPFPKVEAKTEVETGRDRPVGEPPAGPGEGGPCEGGRVHRPGRALRAHSARPPRARRAAKEEGGDLGRGPAAEARARREGREGRGPQWRGPALRPPPPPPPP